MRLRCHAVVDTAFQQVQVWKNERQCEFRVAGAIHAWWHEKRFLTGLAWDNLAAAALLRRDGAPRSILMLGLAGGTATRVLRHLLPDCRLVAVDIDSEIVALAALNMQLDRLGIEVHIADAYEWVAKCRERFDVVIDDVYLAGSDDVYRPGKSDARHIASLRRLLKPGGLLLANLVNGPGHRAIQSRTRSAFREAFPLVRSVTTPDSRNETLVGGDSLTRGALGIWEDRFADAFDRRLWRRIQVRKFAPLPTR
ncbi:MAG: methyltransferase domain-containing protein [Verrucomicrobia bacterium]|nr:MAG: methyltransferase domain-containing protein [Verrucomicrobiota bacterium]TAE89354.1 MAG: methyltransferase domain-containing protein [Verrucomicrobiota bacterium]TAF27770.1 MAG: methyltransferase domain-containing protein [Verrucomicrobiota bacterium]TAF42619.1 MAG: methyltransferase domain-containing protein [Verrucomicrobiota bacterium]